MDDKTKHAEVYLMARGWSQGVTGWRAPSGAIHTFARALEKQEQDDQMMLVYLLHSEDRQFAELLRAVILKLVLQEAWEFFSKADFPALITGMLVTDASYRKKAEEVRVAVRDWLLGTEDQ